MFRLKDYGFITDCPLLPKKEGTKHCQWYDVWRNMILRCYDKNNKSYKNYGAKGVTISEEFHLASNFRDFYLENNPDGTLFMDKDIKGLNCYSREGIIFISPYESNVEMNSRRTKESYAHGTEHYKALSLEDFATKPRFRSSFKRSCKRMGWDFDDFEEIYVESDSLNRNSKKYIYKLKKGNQNEER